MSTEPPPRILPKGLSHETKSAAEDQASTRKVEKVRAVDEVDADERTRQHKKFARMMMSDEELLAEENGPKAPSPFDVFRGTSDTNTGNATPSVFGTPAPSQAPTPPESYGDIDDAMIASPTYTPPPNLTIPPPLDEENNEEQSTTGALPQSENFWEDVDMPPDRPLPAQKMEEAPKTSSRFPKEVPSTPKKSTHTTGAGMAKGETKEPSPFGPPGKPINEAKATSPKKGENGPPARETHKLSEKKQHLPSPFEEAAKEARPAKRAAPEKEGIATARYFAPEEMSKAHEKKTDRKEKTKEQQGSFAMREPDVVPFRFEEQERGGGSGAPKDRSNKIIEIEAPSLTLLPANVQPGTFAATSTATSYLHPSTVSLFFQMVGTMYVMATPAGVSRTEIILNNPAFAHSRFFGSTITIEKYATAPDSFNIRLTGNDAAVIAFRENIPSLMEGFLNSNLPFKVHRIDAEYTIEKPVFRRKERGEEKGEAGGGDGDMGDRRR